ncbi:MAG: hypothetical protein FWD70_00510 [Desulfuromonadales bacterium]|nr:hypothetical protein [Desulfuromonadales bacterium]
MKDLYDDKLNELFKTAREIKPDLDKAQMHFETRVMARIKELKNAKPWYLFIWRSVPLFAIIAIISTIISFTFAPATSADPLAPLMHQDDQVNANYLFGEQQ